MTVQISEVVGMVGVLSGTVAILSVVIPFSWRFIQSKRLHQEELIHRESHNLKLFEALSSSNPRLQLAAAAVLAERLTSNSLKDAEAEHRIIVRALLAVTKNMGPSSNEPVVPKEISKFVADSVVKNREISLKQFDWQNTRLSGAWWESVNASEIDFWQADLSHAGFRKVIFRNSVLVETKLDGSVLVGADLTNAKLQRASLLGTDLRETKLEGTNFVGAIYNERTRFPDGFDPNARGLIPKTTALV